MKKLFTLGMRST